MVLFKIHSVCKYHILFATRIFKFFLFWASKILLLGQKSYYFSVENFMIKYCSNHQSRLNYYHSFYSLYPTSIWRSRGVIKDFIDGILWRFWLSKNCFHYRRLNDRKVSKSWSAYVYNSFSNDDFYAFYSVWLMK